MNDFNRARFIRWDGVQGKACPFYVEVNRGRHRSPEEYFQEHPLNEKIDVFSLGYVLYSILMQKDVYEEMRTKDVQRMVKKGKFLSVQKQEDKMKDAVAVAIRMCLVKDATKRSTSMEVESYLLKKLEEYGVPKF